MNSFEVLMNQGDPIEILHYLELIGERVNIVIGPIVDKEQHFFYSPIKLITLFCLTLFFLRYGHPIFFDSTKQTFSFGITYNDDISYLQEDYALNQQIINKICEHILRLGRDAGIFCVPAFLNHLTIPGYNHANICVIDCRNFPHIIVNIYEPHEIFMKNPELNAAIRTVYRAIFARLQLCLRQQITLEPPNFPCPIILQQNVERDIPGTCQLIGILYMVLLLLKIKNAPDSFTNTENMSPVCGRDVTSSTPVISNTAESVNAIKCLVYFIDVLSHKILGCVADTYGLEIQIISHYNILNGLERPYYLIFVHYFLLMMYDAQQMQPLPQQMQPLPQQMQQQQQQQPLCNDNTIIANLNKIVIHTIGINQERQAEEKEAKNVGPKTLKEKKKKEEEAAAKGGTRKNKRRKTRTRRHKNRKTMKRRKTQK